MRDNDGKPVSAGSGCFIALLIFAGAIAGGLLGQPTIGLLTGLALGVAVAIVLWLKGRTR